MAESNSDPSDTMSDKDVKAPNVLERTKEEIEAILHTKKPQHHHKESHGIRDDIGGNTPINKVKAPNVFERVQEEIEALVQTIHPKKEAKSNGSPLNNETERRDGTMEPEPKPEKLDFVSQEKNVKAPRLERVKEKLEAIMHKDKSPHHHHKETHGTSDDIDESTPVSEVKGPNVFERAKEEIEALVQTIHPKKESSNVVLSPHHHHKETHGTSDDINESTPVSEVKGPNVFERAKEEIEALVQTIHPKKESSNVVPSTKKEEGFRVSIGRGLEKVCSPWGHKRE